jgi:hypothetical protein
MVILRTKLESALHSAARRGSAVDRESGVRSQKINTAIVTCLEHVATSTAPPGAGAADFLIRLLDDNVFTVDEVDEITVRVSIILRGITERHYLTQTAQPHFAHADQD